MLLFKDKINYKGPNGNGFLAHTDAPAYDHIGKINHITANICVDEATKENGYLEVVPGSQNEKIPFSNGGHITAEWEASHEWVPVPLQPGKFTRLLSKFQLHVVLMYHRGYPLLWISSRPSFRI